MTRQRIAIALCVIARRTLPDRRRQWGDAMTAEFNHIDDDRQALAYAGGCLLAAAVERGRDFDTRFAMGLWSVAIVTGLCATIHLACAAHGVDVLFGAPDGMLAALRREPGDAFVVARYLDARPVVIGCLFLLGLCHAAAGWFLVRAEMRLFLLAACAALVVAVFAVATQLSVVWTADGVPSEFYALLVQAAAIPALLLWSNGRHLGENSR